MNHSFDKGSENPSYMWHHSPEMREKLKNIKTWFVDFDRTLFDTDRFTRSLIANPACVSLQEELIWVVNTPRDKSVTGGERRKALWKKLEELVVSGVLVFKPGELSEYVFPDAKKFLAEKGKNSIIVSYGDAAWIHAKITSALPDFPPERIEYAHDKEKGHVIPDMLPDHPGPYGVLEDLLAQLDHIQENFPENGDVTLIEVRHDKKAPSGKYYAVESLEDLLEAA